MICLTVKIDVHSVAHIGSSSLNSIWNVIEMYWKNTIVLYLNFS